MLHTDTCMGQRKGGKKTSVKVKLRTRQAQVNKPQSQSYGVNRFVCFFFHYFLTLLDA